jgi:hypothetical protein
LRHKGYGIGGGGLAYFGQFDRLGSLIVEYIILKEYLNDFIITYLDNIIIYLNSEEEYKKYIK